MNCFVTTIGAILFSSLALGATQKGKRVEIGVEKVFVPATGYNDNNNVEAVIQGELPNPCFTLSDAEVARSGGKITVRQMAWRRLTGACDTGDLIDDPIPFTSVVNLGHLESASYQIQYTRDFVPNGQRTFEVAAAENDEVDEFHYTITRGIDAKEVYRKGEPIRLTLRGFIPAPCYKLKSPLRVEVQGDVVVVWPELVKIPDVACDYELAEFQHPIILPKLEGDTYLIHARSRGGNAVYQSFRVAGGAKAPGARH